MNLYKEIQELKNTRTIDRAEILARIETTYLELLETIKIRAQAWRDRNPQSYYYHNKHDDVAQGLDEAISILRGDNLKTTNDDSKVL
jgi:hypothetical protein